MQLSILTDGFDFINERPGDRIKHSEVVHLWDALRNAGRNTSELRVVLRKAIGSLSSINVDSPEEEQDILEIVGAFTYLENEIDKSQSNDISSNVGEQVKDIVEMLRRYVDRYTKRKR